MSKPMTLADYQREAARTAVYSREGKASGLMYASLGLAGEAGEVANEVKKVYRDDDGNLSDERRERLAKELGDVLWYVAMVADEAGLSLGEIGRQNIAKLLARKASGTLHGSGDNR